MTGDRAIVLLGASNDAAGQLGPHARDRCDTILRLAGQNPAWKVLLTGGFGPHFNVTSRPHTDYVRDYLVERGLDTNRLLAPALSLNTLEDATMSLRILKMSRVEMAVIVTSDFHVPRSQFIFEQLFKQAGIGLSFIGVPVRDGSEIDLPARIMHEQQALARLRALTRVLAGYQ